MAQKVSVMLVCDLHEDEVEGTETVLFGLDGASYEVDACDEHGEQLRDAFAPFVGAARRAGRAPSSGGRRAARTSSAPSRPATGRNPETQKMREWGAKNGFTVSGRGRLSRELQDAYTAAH